MADRVLDCGSSKAAVREIGLMGGESKLLFRRASDLIPASTASRRCFVGNTRARLSKCMMSFYPDPVAGIPLLTPLGL